jgi:UDP-2,4-diacetamido-2,4,6-trideoxy-beta-L-altropyranose hydrolase
VNPLKIAFYTEAGTQRGMGHLIRCYSLYEEFKRYGIIGSFFLDSDIDFSYKFSDLHPFIWDDFRIDDTYDIVVIDSYEASIDIYNTIAKAVRVPVFIDDYGRLEYPKGVIINIAPDAEELFFATKNSNNSYLLGIDYIPLRRDIFLITPKKEEQLFIMLGGSDPYNLSLKIIEVIQDIPVKKMIVSNDARVVEILSSYPNVTVLYKPSDEELISQMSKSSMAISTASMTLYELAYFKIPTIIFALSENQKIGSKQLLKYHLASNLINIEDPYWTHDLKTNLVTLNTTDVKATIDGRGTQRIVEFITKIANT